MKAIDLDLPVHLLDESLLGLVKSIYIHDSVVTADAKGSSQNNMDILI